MMHLDHQKLRAHTSVSTTHTRGPRPDLLAGCAPSRHSQRQAQLMYGGDTQATEQALLQGQVATAPAGDEHPPDSPGCGPGNEFHAKSTNKTNGAPLCITEPDSGAAQFHGPWSVALLVANVQVSVKRTTVKHTKQTEPIYASLSPVPVPLDSLGRAGSTAAIGGCRRRGHAHPKSASAQRQGGNLRALLG